MSHLAFHPRRTAHAVRSRAHVTHTHSDVEGYEQINARLHKAYTWLDKAFSYLDGVKPRDRAPLRRRARPRVRGTAVRARLRRPARAAHRRLSGASTRSTSTTRSPPRGRLPSRSRRAACSWRRRRSTTPGCSTPAGAIEDHTGVVRKCVITVPPAIPAKVSFNVDYQTGHRDRAARQRRPLRPREPRVPQPGDRGAGARRPPQVHPRARRVVPAPRAARRTARHAARLVRVRPHFRLAGELIPFCRVSTPAKQKWGLTLFASATPRSACRRRRGARSRAPCARNRAKSLARPKRSSSARTSRSWRMRGVRGRVDACPSLEPAADERRDRGHRAREARLAAWRWGA